jgi:transposase
VGASEREEFLRSASRVTVAGGVGAERFVLRMVEARVTGAVLCAGKLRVRGEHNALGEHERERDGAVPGCRRPKTTKAVFETYVERALAHSLRPGQVMVMDNLSTHKGGRTRELIEGRGCELLYLPPYSPDLNPIEQAFSKLKGLLRRSESRARGALIESMGAALSAITARDASGFFRHCGYHATAQLL